MLHGSGILLTRTDFLLEKRLRGVGLVFPGSVVFPIPEVAISSSVVIPGVLFNKGPRSVKVIPIIPLP